MKILVVDDETAIVTTVQAYFEREGYEGKSPLEGLIPVVDMLMED